MPVIECHDLQRTFRMGQVEVRALRGVDLRIEPGEFVSIMGPSGCGKSTLLNLLGCLDRPTAGRYFLQGQDVGRLSDARLSDLRNRFIGYVFQMFHLLPRLTALQNVELPLIYRGLPAGERRRAALAALAVVGLAERAGHRPLQMSGGEQQRVAIARALVGRPSLILADEPTGNLDTRNSNEIMALFQRLNREQGITIVQVTHEVDMAHCGRRIIYMRDGRIEREEEIEPIELPSSGQAEPAAPVEPA